ncbi:MAG: uncharacterized protein PWQ12_1006 [Clostridiales bacterium]|nr:uncharacterized protein [Clostridiales bacterium]
MIIEKIYQAALPYLEGKTVVDFRYGVNLAYCRLSDDSVGIAHMFTEEVMHTHNLYALACDAIGKEAKTLALKILDGSMAERTIASAVLNAVSGLQPLSDDDGSNTFGLSFKPDDRVVMIGRIPPVLKKIKPEVQHLNIYDMGLEAHGGSPDLSPMAEQKEGMKNADVILITGTSVLNQTIDGLLAMAEKSREIIIVGPTTPMFPAAYDGTPVTRIAGSVCKKYDPELLTAITRGGSVIHLGKFLQKKCHLL